MSDPKEGQMGKRWKVIWLGTNYTDEPNSGFIGDGVWGVYDTLDTDNNFAMETYTRKEDAIGFVDDNNRHHEEMERIEKFERERQDDDDISDRDRRADELYYSGYGDRVGLDSFAYDSRGNDTGLRESDFI